MEQGLLERFKNRTMDEIDDDMFKARISDTYDKVDSLIGEFTKKFGELCEDKEDELKILGFTLALGCNYSVKFHPDKPNCIAFFGSGEAIEHVLDEVKKRVYEN